MLSRTAPFVAIFTLPPSAPTFVLLAFRFAVLSKVTPLPAFKLIWLFLGAVAIRSPVTVIFPASALTSISRAFNASAPVPVILTSPWRTRYWRFSSKPIASLSVVLKLAKFLTSTCSSPALPVPVAVPFNWPVILAVPALAISLTEPALALPWLLTSTVAPFLTFTLAVAAVKVTLPALDCTGVS